MKKTLSLFSALFLILSLAACNDSTADEPKTPAPAPALPKPSGDSIACGEIPLSRVPLQYCYQDPKAQASDSGAEINVIYYFHGLGGNVNDLFTGNGRYILEGLKRIFGEDMPVIVALSTGTGGVLGSGTPEIVNVGLAQIESQIAAGKTFRRSVIGGSMGGHNALRLAAENKNLFRAVAAVCPAMATFNGYDEPAIAAYLQRNSAVMDLDFFNRAMAIYKLELKSADEWNANNPFTFLEAGAYDGIPIFVSVGREDQLGFVEGVRAFKTRSNGREQMNVTYKEVGGRHCSFDIPAFLIFMRNYAI